MSDNKYHFDVKMSCSGMYGSSPFSFSFNTPFFCSKFAQKDTCGFLITNKLQGCSNAINRVLSKKEGIKSIDISLENQSVDVVSSLPYDDILATIKKTGKEVLSGTTIA